MKKKWVLRHCDLDLWPKVIKFNRVWASAGSNHLAKTASKSIHPFGWNFVHKKCRTHRHTDTQTHTHRHTDKLKWKYNPSTISWRCKNIEVNCIQSWVAYPCKIERQNQICKLFYSLVLNMSLVSNHVICTIL